MVPPWEKYNICSDKAVELRNYLAITAKVLGRKININYVPIDEMVAKYKDTADEGGLRFLAEHMCFDITKARTELEYEPLLNAAETIEETALWAANR